MIIVDDGIATGSTVAAAVMVARDRGAHYVIIAIPVAPREALPQLERIADEVVVLDTPQPFHAVGKGYREFGRSTTARWWRSYAGRVRGWCRRRTEMIRYPLAHIGTRHRSSRPPCRDSLTWSSPPS